MSITLPVIKVSNKQNFSNKIDVRFYNGKLYVSKIEPDGTILEGAEMVLDRLPPQAIYGNNFQGEDVAEVISMTLGINIDINNLNQIPGDPENDLEKIKQLIINGIDTPGGDVTVKIREIIDKASV